jgi:hypothetical protein
MKFTIFLALVTFCSALAVAEKVKISRQIVLPIELLAETFIHLKVVDSEGRPRQFIVTCEQRLTGSKADLARTVGVSFVDLKNGGKQSLLNTWHDPAVDYVITCKK